MKKDKDLHIRITDEKLQALRIIAEKDRRKITAVVDIAIGQYLNKRKI